MMTKERTDTMPAKRAGCTCLSCTTTLTLPGVVYSPWVKRALSNTLAVKDMTKGNA